MTKVIVGLCQITVGHDKADNIQRALKAMDEVVNLGAEIVTLPEMFNCPYNINVFRDYAEKATSGETIETLASFARSRQIYLIGGSIPELGEDDAIYNTAFVFDPSGKIQARHRKVHLFDVNVKNGVQFQESLTLSAGDGVTMVDTPWGPIGVMICYDIRFPELARQMALAGAKVIFVPAAFNMTTGPLHWDLLFRARAVDNQLFMVGSSPARDQDASYVAYGHSLVANPWGKIIHQMGCGEEVAVVQLDFDEMRAFREAVPVLKQRRTDLY